MASEIPCWSCAKNIDAGDPYCRWCGLGQGEHLPWYYSPVAIGLLTVFALGPFSLFLIWRTPRLSQNGRWVATLLTAAFTLYLCYGVVSAVRIVASLAGGVLH